MSLPRSCLTLSRLAGLLTVWSNCLAGWWLGGGGHPRKLPFLFAGATLLYVGGTFLTDAFDARLDRQPRSAPAATALAAQGWGLALLALGAAGLFWLGKLPGGFGVAVMSSIILCHLLRRRAVSLVLLPGVCRFFLYLLAASTATNGVTGWALWCGLALAVYVAGVNGVPYRQNIAGPARHWPILLLLVPMLLALIMDDGGCREAGLLLAAVLALWTARCLRPALWSPEKDVAGSVAGLRAGIVFVDLLAAVEAPREISFVFLLLFGATRLLQRPGTP